MVSIGEIEFLVNFRSMNTEFKKVLQESLEDIGAGVDVNLGKKVDDIVHYLSTISPSAGGRDDFYVFTQKAKMLIPQMNDEGRREDLTNALITAAERSEKIRRTIVGKEEGIGDPDVGERAKEFSDKIYDMLSYKLNAMLNPLYYDIFRKDWKDIETALEELKGGNILASSFNTLVNKLFPETTLNRTFTDLLEEWETPYTAMVGPDIGKGYRIGGEKAIHELKRDIGDGKGSMSDFMNLQNLIIEEAKLDEKDIKDIFLLVEDPSSIVKNKLKKGLEEILKTYTLKSGLLMPKSVLDIITEITGERDIYSTKKGGRKQLDATWIITKEVLDKMEKTFKEEFGNKDSSYIKKLRKALRESMNDFIVGMFQGKSFEDPATDTPAELLMKGVGGFTGLFGDIISLPPTIPEKASYEDIEDIIKEAFEKNVEKFKELFKTSSLDKEELLDILREITEKVLEE